MSANNTRQNTRHIISELRYPKIRVMNRLNNLISEKCTCICFVCWSSGASLLRQRNTVCPWHAHHSQVSLQAVQMSPRVATPIARLNSCVLRSDTPEGASHPLRDFYFRREKAHRSIAFVFGTWTCLVFSNGTFVEPWKTVSSADVVITNK